jgi:Right handed beta helix region
MEGTDHRISNNLIVHTPYGFGVQVYPYDRRIAVVNNTIDDAAHAGIIIGGQTVGGEGRGVSDVDIVNNIITRTDDVAVLCYQGPTNYRIHHNLVFDTAHGLSHCQLGGSNLEADPRYGDDYRLRTGSPGIDTGDPAWTFSPALDGVPRPQGAGIDRGAYEQ